MNTMSMSSVRKLLNKSMSSSKHQTYSKPSSMTSKLESFYDENSKPTDPNIQINQQDTITIPEKSTLKPQNVVEVSPVEDLASAPNPPVQVVVRIRPKTENGKLGDPSIKKISDVCLNVGDRQFSFDSIIDSNSNQEDVFKSVGVPLVKDSLAGYNVSVLSYGQTGSGKRYTLWGPPRAMVEGESVSTQQGLIPRSFQMLFSEIEREKENSEEKQINYQCRCSFLEIYNGQIEDLLDPTQRNLEIKEDVKSGIYVENLTEEYVTCYDDVTQILIKGLSRRKVGATTINYKSSRSHVVFTCVIESWCKETTSNNFSSSKTSRITFVDLAGFGRNKQTDSGKEFEKNRKVINGSLSHLGHLVNVLASGTQPDNVMYRDSSLTHLLQQSLGGNAKLAVICNISPDIKNFVETLSTLRFGQRIRSIQNKPVINEITEEDMDGLTHQIRQLKEELIRAKLGDGQLTRKSIRESVNQLRINLNRSIMLPSIGNDIEDDVKVDESDVSELCKHIENLKHHSCESFSTSEQESSCLQESIEVSSRNSLASEVFEEPVISESPKISILQRKSMVNSASMLTSVRESQLMRSTPESLGASLKKGLEIIDFHQKNSTANEEPVVFSFEHLMLKPSSAVDQVNAPVKTLSELRASLNMLPSSFVCVSCRKKGENVSDEVNDSLKTWILDPKKESKGGEDAVQGNVRENQLEKNCREQAEKIEELNLLVEQLKKDQQKFFASQSCEKNEGCEDGESPKPEKIENVSFDIREKQELLMEIQLLKNKLQAYMNPAPNKSIDILRSSLLSRSIQIRNSMCSQFNNTEELEKERERWTEMESEWISLTDDLRIEIESHRQGTENVKMELQKEKKYTEELDDALHRAVLGHARFVEHFVELQEKYNNLSESHKRVMETIMDVKRAASKAGAKGSGDRYVKAFAAELTLVRAEEKRERERLRKENRCLRMQLRETAEAVNTAGELLVRLREAEETASFTESNMTELQQENEKLNKQLEKVKNKHKMEMETMKQYMAESKLPESALKPPVHYDDEPLPTSTFTTTNDDEAWRSEFGDTYRYDHY